LKKVSLNAIQGERDEANNANNRGNKKRHRCGAEIAENGTKLAPGKGKQSVKRGKGGGLN